MASNCTAQLYLVAKRKSYLNLSARLTKSKPTLAVGEVAMRLDLSLPSALFERPLLEVKVIVPESAVTPTTLPATVLDNVREVLQQQTGMEVRVSVVEPTQVEEEEEE